MISKEFLVPEEVIEFGINLSHKIRRAELPIYGVRQKDVPINEISRDYSYKMDEIGEKIVDRSFRRAWRRGLRYGYVAEDKGIVLPEGESVDWIFMIDVLDGSRLGQAGFEMACIVTTGVRGNLKNPTLKDVEFGILHAVKENNAILAIKGEGVFEYSGKERKPLLSRSNRQEFLAGSAYYFESYTINSGLLGRVISPLNDEVLRKGGFKIEAPSGSYGVYALLKGKVDLHIDPRKRLIDDYPHLNTVPYGQPKVISPMDAAPGFLALEELGYPVTDAYGKLLENIPLWSFDEQGRWKQDNQMSWVAASSVSLHQQALYKLEEGFASLDRLKE